MTNIGSWKFWVIIALALTTLACAGRRERREERRERAEERREMAEQRRAERNQARQTDRASRDGDSTASSQPPAQPAAQSSSQAATFQPISTAPTAAAGGEAKVVFMRATTYAA